MRPTRSQLEKMKPGEFEVGTQQLVGGLVDALQDEAAGVEAAQKTIDQNFKGAAADAERELMAQKLAGLHAEVDQLVGLGKALGQAGRALAVATRNVYAVVAVVESDDFRVKDDWAVEPADVLTRLGMRVLSWGKEYQQQVNDVVNAWDKADQEGSQLVAGSVRALELTIRGEQHTVKDGEGEDVPITVAKDSEKPEQTNSDLNVTIPGWDHTITGDSVGEPGAKVDGVKVKNPYDLADGRGGLPTGANYGPDGKTPLAGFSFPAGKDQYGKDHDAKHDQDGNPSTVSEYASPDTTVMDMSDPKNPKPLGVLKDADNKNGISQGSFAYDPKTHRMVVVGNTGNSDGSPRAMWQSDPVNPGDPPEKWMSSLHKVSGSEQPIDQSSHPSVNSGGNRENQVRQLPDGRWALYDTAGSVGVRMYVADRPEDLFKAQPQLVAGGIQPPPSVPLPPLPHEAPPGVHWGVACAYGASVVAETQNPDGSITQTFRASAWPRIMYPDPDYGKPGHMEKEIEYHPPPPSDYSPQTYTYTVQIGAKH